MRHCESEQYVRINRRGNQFKVPLRITKICAVDEEPSGDLFRSEALDAEEDEEPPDIEKLLGDWSDSPHASQAVREPDRSIGL